MRPLDLAVFAVLAVSACELPPDTAPPAGTCAPALSPVTLADARLRVDGDGRLRDHLGRDVVLRGLNTGGRSKFEPFLPFSIDPDASLEEVGDAADAYFSRLLDWGLDTVRMPFSWEALEPSPGEMDERYLDRYEVMVDRAWSLGLRVIVDFHQDIYASPFCGDGFPPWTVESLTDEPPRHDCPAWFMSYFDSAVVREAFDRFWANEDGVRDAMFDMWSVVAQRFAEHPGVVGFELINEPFAGSAAQNDEVGWKRDVLEPFYEALAERLHVLAPEALLFYDSSGTDAPDPAAAVHPRPAGTGWVYAPHYYEGTLLMGLGWYGALPDAHIEALSRFRDEEGVAVLLGEFGFPDGTEGGNDWLRLTMDRLDEHRLSATLWEYSASDELWNSEDLSVVNADGSERAILDAYVRPRIRALAGRASTFSWDAESGEVHASWIAAEGVTELVLPPRLFPNGPTEVVVEGDGACWTPDLERGEVRVRAPEERLVRLTIR